MNKSEFKSAYNKISLSEEFRAKAREQLMSAAKNTPVDYVVENEASYTGVEYKPSPKKPKKLKTVIGITAAAAAICLAVIGGKYLVDNSGLLFPPADTATEEALSAETPTAETEYTEIEYSEQDEVEEVYPYAQGQIVIQDKPDDSGKEIALSYITDYKGEKRSFICYREGEKYGLSLKNKTDLSFTEVEQFLSEMYLQGAPLIPVASGHDVTTENHRLNMAGLSYELGVEKNIPNVRNTTGGYSDEDFSTVIPELKIPFVVSSSEVSYFANYSNLPDGDKLKSLWETDSYISELYSETEGCFVSDNYYVFNDFDCDFKELVYTWSGNTGQQVMAIECEGDLSYADYPLYFRPQWYTGVNSFGESPLYYPYVLIEYIQNQDTYYSFMVNKNKPGYAIVTAKSISLDDFVYIVNQVYANTSNIEHIGTTGQLDFEVNYRGAHIISQRVELVEEPYLQDSDKTLPADRIHYFDTPKQAADKAIDLSGYIGITLVGKVSDTDEKQFYGEDKNAQIYDGRVLSDYVLQSDSYLVDEISSEGGVVLHYKQENGTGEAYVSAAPKGVATTPKYCVTETGGRVVGMPTEPMSIIFPTEVLNAMDFTYKYGKAFVGGYVFDGVNYFIADNNYGSKAQCEDSGNITISAKGMEVSEFISLLHAVIQNNSRGWGYNENIDPNEIITHYAQTEHGTLVLNKGDYYGTGGGYMYDVKYQSALEGSVIYTPDDIAEFTGNGAIKDIVMPYEVKSQAIYYGANYAEFHDGYNIQLFREGKPLEGEADDSKFHEAKKYFSNGIYISDKTDYFSDKTPTVQSYTLSFYNGADYWSSDKRVDIKVTRGDFSERYMGFGFRDLPPEPSAGFCEDIVRNCPDPENPDFVYAAYYDDSVKLDGEYLYGGFCHDGLYYEVIAAGLSETEFADIMAALVIGEYAE